jgi:hypothetical protein
MPDPDESVIPDQVERELLLPASPEDVWSVVVGPGWLAAEVRLELVPGGEASFSCDEWSKDGWVEEAIPPSNDEGTAGTLAFWWSDHDEPATRVELTVECAGEALTRLRVVEARPLEMLDVVGIPLPDAGGGAQGPAMLVAA